MADVQWYYARNDKQYGPVSAAELKQLADAGRLSPDDLLWREGMDAWTTAINLRGLFSDEADRAGAGGTVAQVAAQMSSAATRHASAAVQAARRRSLPGILRGLQILLWSLCVVVVLLGVVVFMRGFDAAQDPAQEAAAATVSAAFFVGAYVLARCGEKLSRLLLRCTRKR